MADETTRAEIASHLQETTKVRAETGMANVAGVVEAKERIEQREKEKTAMEAAEAIRDKAADLRQESQDSANKTAEALNSLKSQFEDTVNQLKAHDSKVPQEEGEWQKLSDEGDALQARGRELSNQINRLENPELGIGQQAIEIDKQVRDGVGYQSFIAPNTPEPSPLPTVPVTPPRQGFWDKLGNLIGRRSKPVGNEMNSSSRSAPASETGTEVLQPVQKLTPVSDGSAK